MEGAQFLHFIKETEFNITNGSLPQRHISKFKPKEIKGCDMPVFKTDGVRLSSVSCAEKGSCRVSVV